MKKNTALVVVVLLIITSCTKKETTPPTAGATNSVLLAGPKGSSISWKIASISQTVNGTTQTVVPASASTSGIPACEADNIFQFSYTSSQSYQQTEGATSCTAGDPSTVEKGSWAFTDDGKTLLIDGTVNITVAQVQLQAEPFLGLMILDGQPLTVTQLTATSLTLSYSYIDSNSATNVITLVFSKM